MLLHINPTRQRGKRTGSLARASGWYMTFFAAGVIVRPCLHEEQPLMFRHVRRPQTLFPLNCHPWGRCSSPPRI